MYSCNYTNNTEYQFNNECCNTSENINLVGVYPQNKLENVLQCNPITNKWVQFYVSEIVDIPEQKPDIEGIVGVNSCVEIISQRVIKTPEVTGYTTNDGTFIPGNTISNSECTNLTGRKLVIEGLLNQKIIYTALVDNQALHSASFTIPFSVFIIIDKNTPLSQTFKLYSYIEDIFACQLSERSVFKNTTLFIKASPVC
ncbi:UNVERIFIED_CONTAM: uncharacterized protein DUF3794 [Acetivibrio alkalicellulosi]